MAKERIVFESWFATSNISLPTRAISRGVRPPVVTCIDVNGAPSARSNGEKWMSFSPSASTASKWSGGASGSTHGASGGRSV